MELPQPFLPQEAKEKILLILYEGIVRPTFHCQQDSMQKRNVGIDDILVALETGEVQRKPEWDDNHQNWKYKVLGKDIENDDLTVVTVIIENDLTLKIVTVW